MPTFIILDDTDDDDDIISLFMRLISDNAYEAPSKIVIGVVPCLSVMIIFGKMVFAERVVEVHDFFFFDLC